MSKVKAAPKYNTIICNVKGQWTKLVLTDAELGRAKKRVDAPGLTESEQSRLINGMNRSPMEIKGIRYYVVNASTAGRN